MIQTSSWSDPVATKSRRPTARAARRPPPPEGFGPRLVRLRLARGLTQESLGAMVGLSNRMLAYYERDDAEPPGALLPALAAALHVSTDVLLGVTSSGPSAPGGRPACSNASSP